MKDDLQTPYVQAWNIGMQREIMKNTVLEARYLGTRGDNVWHTYNLNEVNIFENGFLQEFKNAQQNLAINAGGWRRPASQNQRPARQVAAADLRGRVRRARSQAALPAAIRGSPTARSSRISSRARPARSPTAWRATRTILPHGRQHVLAVRAAELQRAGPVSDQLLLGESRTRSAGASRSWTTTSWTRYHALQLQFRRRYADGLQLT